MIKDNIHSGHRRRIIERFLKYGPTVFADYEILEILLFASIRYGDTNPLSKSILKSVRGLLGLLGASRDKLLQINGVGEKSAELLLCLKALYELIGRDIGIFNQGSDLSKEADSAEKWVDYDDVESIGNMLVNYFRDKDKCEVVALAIDNNKRIFSFKKLFDADFSSGIIRGAKIMEYVRESRAPGLILAHNHPYGLPYPSDGDIATNKMVGRSIGTLGVYYANHYIVSADKFYPIMSNNSNTLYNFSDTEGKNIRVDDIILSPKRSKEIDTIYDIYSKVCSIDKSLLYDLYSECHGLEEFLSLRAQTLTKRLSVSNRDAVIMNIMTDICKRAIASKCKIGKKHSDEKICEFLRAGFYASDCEYMAIVSFDEMHKFLGCDYSPRGVINYVALGPQLAMEWVNDRGSREVYVAHNHPSGDVDPSYTDLKTMQTLEKMFSATSVEFTKAVIVSGNKNKLIALKDYDLSKLL